MTVPGLLKFTALTGACCAFWVGTQAATFESQEDEYLYYWGTEFGNQLNAAGVNDPKQVELVVKGLVDRTRDTAPEFGQEYSSLLNNWLVQERKKRAEEELARSEKFLARAAGEDGVVKTDSGLIYQELAAGNGDTPKKSSRVRTRYVASLPDGTVFDRSADRGDYFDTRLTNVIKCWSEGLQMMKVGGKARLVCPPALAYGERGTPDVPPNSALNFEIELVEILN